MNYFFERGANNLDEILKTLSANNNSTAVYLIVKGAKLENYTGSLNKEEILSLYSQGLRDFGKYQPIIDEYRKEIGIISETFLIKDLNKLMLQHL
jgi:hypothetical protein